MNCLKAFKPLLRGNSLQISGTKINRETTSSQIDANITHYNKYFIRINNH